MRDLLRPVHRSDGSVEFHSNGPYELQRLIQEGDPDVGWYGDPFLGLFQDKRPGREAWWVYEALPGRKPQAILKWTEALDKKLLVKLGEMRRNGQDLKATVRRAEEWDRQQDEERAQKNAELQDNMLRDLAKAAKKDGLI